MHPLGLTAIKLWLARAPHVAQGARQRQTAEMNFRRGLSTVLLLAAGFLAWGYFTATADPIVRRTTLSMPDMDGVTKVRAVLISDIHVAGPDMPPDRLARIVGQINALKPDLVLIAGDFVSDKRVATRRYDFKQAVSPLAGLRPTLGTIAVLGNHDHWRNPVEANTELAAVGIRVLNNEAVRAGPLVVGGLDDDFTGHADLGKTIRAMWQLRGSKILLSHSPDPFPEVPDGVGLTVAGHTHCGQIRLPVFGAISYMSRYGDRYACGLIREGKKTLIVGSGVGTSLLPLRFGAIPDIWLVDIVATKAR